MALSFQDGIKSKYLLLTTFTKDGRPKPTAIWGVPEGDKLLVIGGGGHRLTLVGERFVGLVAEDIAQVGDRGGDFGDPCWRGD